MDKIITLENLQIYHNEISKKLDNKQDVISDLDQYVKKSELPTIPNKISSFENDCNYVSLEVVERMIADAIANIGTSDKPITGEICTIDENNSIVIDTTQLQNDTYTLKYVNASGNVLENYDEITTFEINN